MMEPEEAPRNSKGSGVSRETSLRARPGRLLKRKWTETDPSTGSLGGWGMLQR